MKTLKATLILLAVIFMTSCSPYTYTSFVKYDESTVRYMNPAMTPMLITPTIADLDISKEKVTVTESYPNTLSTNAYYAVNNESIIETMKNNTLSKAAKKHGADVIIAPLFEIHTSENGETINVTVTGYPAKFINIRNANTSDSSAMKIYEIETNKPKLETSVVLPK